MHRFTLSLGRRGTLFEEPEATMRRCVDGGPEKEHVFRPGPRVGRENDKVRNLLEYPVVALGPVGEPVSRRTLAPPQRRGRRCRSAGDSSRW
jgi:hypothetical protein